MNTSITTGRVTIYSLNEFGMGYRKVEAMSASVEVRPVGQFSKAVIVTFRKPRARRECEILEADSHGASVLVLDGWGHPAPPSKWGRVEQREDGTRVYTGKHAGLSPQWGVDFSAMIDEHIARTGARVVADYRGHDCR